MKALILANGRATRLAPLASWVPKALVPVANRPVIWYVIQSLRTAGIERLAVTVGAGTRQIADYVESAGNLGIKIECLWDRHQTGTGGALRDHREYMDGEPIVVVPADIIVDVDVVGLIRHHETYQPAVTVAVSPRDLRNWSGDVLVADGPYASAYLFKPGRQSPSDLGSMGAWVVSPAALSLLPASGFCDFSAHVLPRLPTATLTLGCFHTGDVYQRDVGTLSWLYEANTEALTGMSPARRYLPPAQRRAPLDSVIVRGSVLVGTGAIIAPSARIYGPAVIGPGSHVGEQAAVHASVILPGSTVPPGSLVSNGIFGTGMSFSYLYGDDHQGSRLVTADHGEPSSAPYPRVA